MSPALEPPTEAETESTTSDHAIFPYDTDGAVRALPSAQAICVLVSSDRAGPDGTQGSSACPACGSETINGAGRFTCTDCQWTGHLR